MDPRPPSHQPSGNAAVSVRPARAADAPAIARVQELTWRTAYRDVLPVALLDGWDPEAAAGSWTAAITSPPTPAHGVVVAMDGGEVVGFAAYGPAELAADEAPSPDGPTTEVAILLVEPRWGRRGHGSRLLAAVTDLARATGARRLLTWLTDSDDVSAAFFESAGWDRDGWARTLDTGTGPLREQRWHALLDPDPADGAPEGAEP